MTNFKKNGAKESFFRFCSRWYSRLEGSYKWSLLHKYIHGSFHKQIKGRVFFLHIPKCGGTSVKQALKRHFISHIRLKDPTFQLNIHALYKAKDVLSLGPREYNEYLLPYFMADQRYNYIGGHFFWNSLAYENFKNEWDFITILREPVSRWFSHYFYNRYKKGNFYKIHDDLQSYIFSEEGIQIGQTYLGHLTDSLDQIENNEDKLVEKAINNLNKFKLVGCLEHMDKFMKKFEKLYGVRLKIDKKNQNPKADNERQKEITEEIFERVKHICAPDQKIYQHALSLAG